MLQAFTRPNRRLTVTLLVLCSAFAIAAALVGLADNPPGLLLALLVGMAGVAAFVHPWRTVDQFWHLVFYAALGLVLFGVLHNVFEAFAHHRIGTSAAFAFAPLSVTSFLVAILVCPAAFLVGIIGVLVTFIRSRRHSRGPAA